MTRNSAGNWNDMFSYSIKVKVLAFVMFFRLPGLEAQMLKSVIYDFDGFDLGATELPEGDYSFGDLSYQISANPLQTSDMLGDRALKLNVTWNAGYGAFGRGISRYLELDLQNDRFNFYFYNPLSNGNAVQFEVTIADDDNGDNNYHISNDDAWKKTFTVNPSTSWQLVSAPLKDFTDSNAGGNGIFDISHTQNKGMLLLVEFRFDKSSPQQSNGTYYIDMINFSEGNLPAGNNSLQLPFAQSGDHCLLGAHQVEADGAHHLIPQHFEGLFPKLAGKKIKYVHTFLQWSYNGSAAANALPGQSIQTLISNGYRPVITWEPLFLGYALNDPVQPNLNKIINGNYNTYIDAFADKIKTYSDTVIIRLMHEFDGDWYPWCIATNGQDPQKFISAWKKVVDRFKAKGVNKVRWMWCPNSSPVPQASWNWAVNAFPGSNYVDIVASDIYNAHYPADVPWWRSFRWQATECLYYLQKYFPSKPLFICELGCRERSGSEMSGSESKSGWFARMDKELQSNFRKVRALIFFNEHKDNFNWLVNTSAASLQSLTENVWKDDYYFMTTAGVTELQDAQTADKVFFVYPNPVKSGSTVKIVQIQSGEILLYNCEGRLIGQHWVSGREKTLEFAPDLPAGVYLLCYRPKDVVIAGDDGWLRTKLMVE